jgi:hypothetical protein
MGKLHGGDDLHKVAWHSRLIFTGERLSSVVREVGHGAHHAVTPSHSWAVDLQVHISTRSHHGHSHQPTQGKAVGGDHQAIIDLGVIADGR